MATSVPYVVPSFSKDHFRWIPACDGSVMIVVVQSLQFSVLELRVEFVVFRARRQIGRVVAFHGSAEHAIGSFFG